MRRQRSRYILLSLTHLYPLFDACPREVAAMFTSMMSAPPSQKMMYVDFYLQPLTTFTTGLICAHRQMHLNDCTARTTTSHQ